MDDDKEIQVAAKLMKIDDSRKKEFLDDIFEITKITAVKNFDGVIKQECKDYSFEILRRGGFKDIKRNNIDSIVEGIIAKLPHERGFLGKKLEALKRDVLTDEELEQARLSLMEFVSFAQSEKIDRLCMDVMANPYYLKEYQLKNWLDLMVKNCSNKILENFTKIIESIKNENNLPEEIRAEIQKEQKKCVDYYKNQNGIKRHMTFKDVVKAVGGSLSQFYDDKIGGQKKGEYINIVVDRFPEYCKFIISHNSPLSINSTLGYVQTICKDMDLYERYIPALKDRKEQLIYAIASNLTVVVNSESGNDAYAKIVDLSISNLKEPSTINKVLDKLFEWDDLYLIIDKAKIVLTDYSKQIGGEDKYPIELVRGVAFKFIDLLENPSLNDASKENIKSILITFVQKCESYDLRESVISQLCKTSCIHKNEYINSLLAAHINSVNLFEIILFDDSFKENKKQIVIDALLTTYKKYDSYTQSSVYSLLLSAACGEINLPLHLRNTIVDGLSKYEDNFLSDVINKTQSNPKLWNNLPDSIRNRINNDKNISENERAKILLRRLTSIQQSDIDESSKINLKNDLTDFIQNAKDKSESKLILDEILTRLLN